MKTALSFLCLAFMLTACNTPTAPQPDVVGVDAPAERILESKTSFLTFMNCALNMAPEEGQPAIQKAIDDAESIEEDNWTEQNQKLATSAQFFSLEFGTECGEVNNSNS